MRSAGVLDRPKRDSWERAKKGCEQGERDTHDDIHLAVLRDTITKKRLRWSTPNGQGTSPLWPAPRGAEVSSTLQLLYTLLGSSTDPFPW
jgi:hypothetical protein